MSFLLRHIEEIIQAYKGPSPLAIFLKNYFKRQPRLGSRDRKAITEACYLYYRAASFYPTDNSPLTVIAKGMQWSGAKNSFLKKILDTELSKEDEFCTPDFTLASKGMALSEGISEKEWLASLWQQPDLFLRLIEHKDKSLAILKNKGIRFRLMPEPEMDNSLTLALPNGSKIDQLLSPQDYIIQDYASQMAANKATSYREKAGTETQQVWDVCAGAGGKSLYWKSRFPQDFIFATDIRKSILYNLKKRFQLYGFQGLKTEVMDVSLPKKTEHITPLFPFILCDVPCSGSGTWSRTPEQFYFFQEDTSFTFPTLQLQIALAASRKLLKGGMMAYITCSVFEEENERVVQKLLTQNNQLRLIQMQIVNGIAQKADCLFIAILQQI